MSEKKTDIDLGLVFNSDGYEGELLQQAAIYDDSKFLEDLLNEGCSGTVKSTDQSGRTPLHTAASHGSVKCVKLLLHHGADPNAVSGIEDNCFTPVHHAAKNNHLTCLENLLEYEANLDLKNSFGKKVLDVAQDENNHACVTLINTMKEQREKEQEEARCEELYDVIDDGNFETAKDLLELMSDPYATVNSHYRGPFTYLYRASIGGHLDIVRLLINYKADGSANLDSGLTPLYGACFAGHLAVVECLADKFPEQLGQAVTVDKMYPLHAAIVKGHSEIVKYLLTLRQREHEVEAKESPLPRNRMSSFGQRHNVQNLDEFKSVSYVDVNQPMKAGFYTPLHLAVLHSNIEIVKTLLSCTPIVKSSEYCPSGSLIIDKLANAKTAFHHALVLNKIEIAELLLMNGNAIDQPFEDDIGKYTPFQYACEHSPKDMVTMLIKNGAKDFESVGLAKAIDHNRMDVVKVLLQSGVQEDGDGKVVVAASEMSLGIKPISINWSQRNLNSFVIDWLFDAAFSMNIHIQHRLNSDPGLKLKVFTSINLSENNLETVPIILFQLPSLKYLYLSENKLTSLPSASESSLESMTSTTENWNCPTLEELELQNNDLTYIPKVLFQMPMLHSIDLANNKLTELPFEMWAAPRLKVLLLEKNFLKELPYSSDKSRVSHSVDVRNERASLASVAVTNNAEGKKINPASSMHVYSKRPTWDGNEDDSDDEEVHYLNKSGLNKLDLSNNQFTQIPVGLPCLAQNLSRLILKKNKIIEVDSVTLIPYSLTTLDLSGNGLRKFDLSEQKQKTEDVCFAIVKKQMLNRPLSYPSVRTKFCLHCRHRQLADLTHLVLSDNHLDNLPLSQRVVKGYIDSNQKMLFPNLKTLDLGKNKLSSVPTFIGKLTKLCSVSFENNPSIDVLPSELGLCSELYELKIDQANIKDPPRNIMEKQTNDGRRDIRFLTGYLRSLHDKAQAYPNIKLMVVGVHGIGKTSLLNALRKDGSGSYQQAEHKGTFNERRIDEKVGRPKSQSINSTVGVDICDWQYQRRFQRVIKFSTWDFGGQTEYYATHQCFLSRRALYLLLWRLTDGINGVKQLEHWLLNIQERAPNSCVIIVGTYLDEIIKKYSREYLAKMRDEIKRRYMFTKMGGWKPSEKGLPNIVDIVEVSCKSDTNISKLRELIYDTVANLKADGKDGHMNLLDKKIPASYIAVEKAVTTIAANLRNEMPVLEEKHFRKQIFDFLKSEGAELRNGDEELDQAVQFLHDYGILLHYDDPALRDLYFIDPQWLCDMLAHVVTVRSVNPFIKNGVLKISDLQNQIFHGEKRFPSSMVMKYVNLMSKFEVAIKISDKFLLIPSLLPDKQKECPVVCDIESSELRKAMNIHAYLHDDVYRRQYLMSYTPSGFWARLLARLIADDRICKIVSSCCDIQGSGDVDSEQARADRDTLMRAAPPEWACWKTGIELSCFGTKLLRVCQLDPDEAFYGGNASNVGVFVKSLTWDGVQKMVPVEILAPNVTISIEKFIQFCDNGQGESVVGFRVVGVGEESSQAACQLLVITVEHIDSLFAEWFPKIDGYTNIHGSKAVQRVSFCNLCLYDTLEKTDLQNMSNVQDVDWMSSVKNNTACVSRDGTKEQSVFTNNYHAILRTESVDSIVILEKDDLEHNVIKDDINYDTCPFEDTEGISVEELELLREYRHNAKGCIIAFELEEASKLLRKGIPLACPYHGKVSMEQIFPDLCFKDLDKKYIITQDQIKQGTFLADGAFGDIYKGVITVGNKSYEAAMKIPKEKEKEIMATLFSYDTYKSIRQEIAILLPIRHPYVIDFLGISLTPFAMLIELAPLGALDKCYRKYSKKGKKLSPHVIQKILQQVSSGLKYLHRHHIIYRDLKCENVLVWKFPNPSDNVMNHNVMIKLADYGISRSVSLSGTKGYHGTPGYMAPEILRYTGKESYTAKVDCFSFGSLIYELISLKQPFRDLANNKANVVQQHMMEGRRPKLTSSEKRFPVLMLSLLYRCWGQDSDSRPSASEIHNLTSLEEFPKIIDILGLDNTFKFQCAATTNQSQCVNNTADSRSTVGSHLWFCGHSGASYAQSKGTIMVSSYHENKYCHVTNIKLSDRILMVCTVGSTIWLGTESGLIQVFCALQFKPLAVTELHKERYILRIIHSTATHSVFIALDDGSVYGYADNLSSYSEIISETSARILFPYSTISVDVRHLVHNKRFTGDTEMHCLIGVGSHIERRYTDDTVTFKDGHGSLTSTPFQNESYLDTPPTRSSDISYELWCGQGRGTILILDMNNLRKMATLPVKGMDVLDPTLRGLKVTFMETSRSVNSMTSDTNPLKDDKDSLTSNNIWLVVYPGTEVARWSVDDRCVHNTFDASNHAPNHDLNSSKVSSKTKALKAGDAQISALSVVDDSMYIGTKLGCFIICDAIAMTARVVIRCYEECIESIIPLRMIASRSLECSDKKLILTCGRSCYDGWIRNVDRRKHVLKDELTILTWNNI